MKKIFLCMLLIVPLILLGAGCEPVDDNGGNIDQPILDDQASGDGASNGSDGTTSEPSTELAKETVSNYMKHTLGTLPDSEIDYDKAREYMTSELAQEFTTPMFVPVSYCMQDGPEAVDILSAEESGNEIVVKVRGLYGKDWSDMWDFVLVSVGDEWLIDEIKCLD